MSLDLQLFVEQAAWLAPQLSDPSRLGVVTWLGKRLEPPARRRFLAGFPLFHQVQRQAEQAVCGLLGRVLVADAQRLVAVEDVTRAVDWPSTYTRSLLGTRTPRPMLARVKHAVPDRVCLGALVTLARGWAALLEVAHGDGEHGVDYSARIAALHRATGGRLLRGLPAQAFGTRHAGRLRRLDAEAAAQVGAIEEAIAFWNRSFGSHQDDREALERLGQALNEADAENIDTLLEATTALSIARAALLAEPADCPKGIPWEVHSLESSNDKYPVLTLRSGELICEIAKGTPRLGGRGGQRVKVKDLLSDWANEVLPRRADGRSRATARQPDLVVSFWLARDPGRVVFALGDAKRNASGDGETYLRAAIEVASTYLMSFGHYMGLKHATASTPFVAGLMPAVTLFCRQGVREDAGGVQRLREDRGAVVMAFDLEKHMNPSGRPWGAPVLAAWVGSLGRQALRVLAGGA